MRPAEIIPLLDLTTLTGSETAADIDALCERALTHGVAAVCVYGRWVERAKASGVRVATVANFPEGDSDPARARAETSRAVQDGADEIDVVIPFAAGPAQWAAVVAAARAASDGRTLKVILESGALGPERTAQAARVALAYGADFLKTSTGKRRPGATLEAARVMIQAGGGFKAAGGVRSYDQATAYTDLFQALRGERPTPATFRIGASALLDDLLGA